MSEKKDDKALVKSQDRGFMPTVKDIEKIKTMFLPKAASDLDVERFVAIVKSYGLNPFLNECWAIPFRSKKRDGSYETKLSIFAGLNGFLSIAHRSGVWGGGPQSVFGHDKGGKLLWAESKVWNKSCPEPTVYRAYYNEYYNERNPLWKNKPRTMLEKVATVHALRRAFNIHGIYSPDEMYVNDTGEVEDDTKQTDEKPRGDIGKVISVIDQAQTESELQTIAKAIDKREWTEKEVDFITSSIDRRLAELAERGEQEDA